MLLATAISTLTGPNTLIVLLEYINLLQSDHIDNIYKANTREEMLILGLTLPHTYLSLIN